jgi:hypothetical protein
VSAVPAVPSNFVSLNRPNSIGNTTQLRRLPQRHPGLQPLRAIHEHCPEAWEQVAADAYKRR